MKILGLLNSNVHGGDANIPEPELFPERIRKGLERELGELVEIRARAVWPRKSLPTVVDGWMRDFEPDLVVFPISVFWFGYESVPVRLDRQLGPLGRGIAKASLKAAATPWLAHNPVFQSGRRTAQRFVGGRSYFEPEEVIAVSRATIRAILRSEGASLVVLGPSGGEKWSADAASAARIAARKQQVDEAMRAFCRENHVQYLDRAMLLAKANVAPDAAKAPLQGDDLHLNAEGHRQTADRYLQLSLALCREAKARGEAVRAG